MDSIALGVGLIPHDLDPDYNLTNVAFSWKCTEFNETYMYIQIQFENPLYVSRGGMDILEVTVRN